MDNKLIIERIKMAMSANNVNAAELSRRTGLAESTISRYMSGKAFPKQNAIGSIAEALHVNPAWLLGYDVETKCQKAGQLYYFQGQELNLVMLINKMNDDQLDNLYKYAQFILNSQDNDDNN